MAKPSSCFLFFTLIMAVSVILTKSGSSETSDGCGYTRGEILELKLNESAYDPQFAPFYDEDHPVLVSIQIMVLSVDNVNEAAMEYSLTIFLRQSWTDERLNYEDMICDNSTISSGVKEAKQNQRAKIHAHNGSAADVLPGQRLELDSLTMRKVWVPDTYFSNERSAIFHEQTVPNRLMHIFPNGTVYYSLRLSMTLTCDMDLSKYPFDKQTCPFYISSYGYTEDMINYTWNEFGAFKVRGAMSLPTFSITNWHTKHCDEKEYDVGNFSCLRLSVSLARSYGYYVTQIYVPSVLIVVLSWVSFWLDIDAIPARISLGLLTVLTMTTMGVGARSDLPRVSYVKAIDLWMAVCLLFVFSALLEFAYVNVTTRVEKRRMSMREAVKLAQAAAAAETLKNERPQVNSTVVKRQRARMVDKMSRIVFPAVFITFNLFYWIFFMI